MENLFNGHLEPKNLLPFPSGKGVRAERRDPRVLTSPRVFGAGSEPPVLAASPLPSALSLEQAQVLQAMVDPCARFFEVRPVEVSLLPSPPSPQRKSCLEGCAGSVSV